VHGRNRNAKVNERWWSAKCDVAGRRGWRGVTLALTPTLAPALTLTLALTLTPTLTLTLTLKVGGEHAIEAHLAAADYADGLGRLRQLLQELLPP
jgi:hypothetical protein